VAPEPVDSLAQVRAADAAARRTATDRLEQAVAAR
jgi:hypothetical protein